MLKFCGKDQSKIREQKKNIGARPCCGIRLQFTKYTVWPRDDDLVVEGLRLMTLPSGLPSVFFFKIGKGRPILNTYLQYPFT